MADAILKSIKLDNQSQLDLMDASQKVAADRWLVRLNIRLTVPVTALSTGAPDDAGPRLEDVRAELGERVLFEQTKERNFVDDREKDAVLNNLHDAFMATAAAYLAHPLFPQKLILKKYHESIKKKGLRSRG